MIRPGVSTDSPIEEQPAIGVIGMGAMGTMYAHYLALGGWKKCVGGVFCCFDASLADLCAEYMSATSQADTRRSRQSTKVLC